MFGVQIALDLLATLGFVWCAGSTGSAGDSGASKFPAPVRCHHVHVLASSSLCDENRRQRHNAGDFTYCPALSFSSASVVVVVVSSLTIQGDAVIVCFVGLIKK